MTRDAGPTNLLAGDALAASLPGVSVVSNSWGLTGMERRNRVRFINFRHAQRSHRSHLSDREQRQWSQCLSVSTGTPSAGNDGYYPATSHRMWCLSAGRN